ncbi:MAG TPA: S41 family peptidase [Rhodanobacteraceae bacterium]
MRLASSVLAVVAVLCAPLALAQRATPAPAATRVLPAMASSSAAPNQPTLQQIRDFTRVYEIIRQAYVKKIDNQTLMNAAITGMLSQLDPHSAYLDRNGMQQLADETHGAYVGLGVLVTTRNHHLMVITPLDDSPAAKAGIQPGDEIVQINHAPVDPDHMQASINKLRGKLGSKITLTFMHAKDATPITKTLTRSRISMVSVRIRTLAPGYACIRISQFQENTTAELHQRLATWIAKHGQPKGVVLDLRSNPGGVVNAAVGVADTFLDGGLIVYTRGRLPDSDMRFVAQPGDMLHGAPMVVLVNHGTASAAEILTGALKDNHRAVIMGQRTFGKGVVQTVIPVDADHMLKLTTARYYTPDGTSIQAAGITPDIIIPDLVANRGDGPPTLIGAEADLAHHLVNPDPAAVRASQTAAERTLASNTSLAEDDYALAQAFSVLQGLVAARQP